MVQLSNEHCNDTLSRLDDSSIDLILQDLPYNTTDCEWEYEVNLTEMWGKWLRVIKDNGAIIFTARQPFTSKLVISNEKMYRHKWVWLKGQSGSFANAKYMPMQVEEDILVFSKKTCNYYPIMSRGKLRKKGGNKSRNEIQSGLKQNYFTVNDEYYPVNILEYPNSSNKNENIHPTQKPVDLMRYLIKTYSKEGDTVFDGYSGSGTTAIACIKEKRLFIGSELNKEYFDLSLKRIEDENMVLSLF